MLVLEGGAAGHLAHLYDNGDLSYNELVDILTKASRGELVGTEKTDGFNIYLGFKDGKARAVRNKGDIIKGGMDTDALLGREFKGGEKVKQIYTDAFLAFEKAVNSLTRPEIAVLFGEDGNTFLNTEIMAGQTNVLNYDRNVLSIHRSGHKRYDPVSGEINVVPPKELDQMSVFLDKIINKFEQSLSGFNFKVQQTALQKLEAITDDTILETTISKLKAAGFHEDMTIDQFVNSKIMAVVKQRLPQIPDDLVVGVSARIVKLDGAPSLIDLKKRLKDPSLYSELKEVVDDSASLLLNAIFPVEEAIHDFAVEVLKGVQSAYVLDHNAEVQRIKDEVGEAIKNIASYSGTGKEQAHEILKKQLLKLKHIDNISTTVEGFVFQVGDQVYKFTGNFAPINTLLGLFKYGRGSVPAMQKSLQEQLESGKTIALFPGSFKPPHKGHMAIVEYLASKYDEVLVIVSTPLKAIRSDINPRTAADIFNLYIKDANIGNAYSVVSDSPSPMGAAYGIIEKRDFDPNTNVVVATSTKDAGRYPQKDLDKAASKNPTNPKASEVTLPAIESDAGKPFSASDFRSTIKKVKSGNGSKDMLWEFTPEYISIGTKEAILNLLSVGPMQINELYDIIKEMSTMAAGSVEGSSGSVTKNKKEKRKRGVTPMQTMNEEEQELREVVRAAISLFKKNEMLEFKKSKLEEQHLRYIVGKLIQEASDGQPVHDNTGINVLEDLLKKIVPVIQVDYKIMTTSEIQRKSFRAHILNAVQNSLKPDIYKKEDALPSTPALNEKKAKKVKIDLDQEEAEELDQSKFIDVFDTEKKKIEDEEATKTPESRLSAGLEGQKLDSTGRNMALQTFKKIDTSIVDAYVMLDDLQDKDLFYDYLITNLKLYFDKFEEEMADMPDSEPTTPEYAQEKADLAAEDEPITIEA